MPKLRKLLPTKWWSSFLLIVATYIIATDFLANLLLLLINCVGYLPYSDRPGPGWQPAHLPSKDELRFFLSFAQALLPGSALYGGMFGLAGLLFGVCSVPRWVIRLLGAPLAFLASALIMSAAGWMIAISALGVYVAAGCAAIWALLLLPLLVVPKSSPLPMLVRLLLPLTFFGAGCFYLVRPFLPQAPIPALNFDFTRCNDAGMGPIVPLSRAWEDDSLIRKAGLASTSCHLESAGQTSSSGTDDRMLRFHLLFLKPTSREVNVPVPEQDGTLIIIDGDDVRFVPDSPSKRKETLHIHEDPRGFSMKNDGNGRMDNWFWYEWSPQTGNGSMDMRLFTK